MLFEQLHKAVIAISPTTLVIWLVDVFLAFFMGEIERIVLNELVYALSALCHVLCENVIGLAWSVALTLFAKLIIDFTALNPVGVITAAIQTAMITLYLDLDDVKALVGLYYLAACLTSTSCTHNLISFYLFVNTIFANIGSSVLSTSDT